MTTFKPGDRVIVNIDGHDTEWTVRNVFYAPGFHHPARVKRLIVERDQISMNLPHELVRPVSMEEPTRFGAMVQTDNGPAVRHTEHQRDHHPWIIDGDPACYRTFGWSELKNPRPYTGGDDD